MYFLHRRMTYACHYSLTRHSCTFASTPPRRGRVGPRCPCPPRRHVSLSCSQKRLSFLTTINGSLIASFSFSLLQRCLFPVHVHLSRLSLFVSSVTAPFSLVAPVAFFQLRRTSPASTASIGVPTDFVWCPATVCSLSCFCQLPCRCAPQRRRPFSWPSARWHAWSA